MEEDKKLVERAVRGDKEAYEMIIHRYQQPMLNYIGRMIGERESALDFTQEIFLKTYSSLQMYQPKYKFSTWLFKIASNYIIDYWRKKKLDTFSMDHPLGKDDDGPLMQIADEDYSIPERFELQEIRKRIESALEKIPPELRELFIWRHVNEFSYEEIAEIKGIPVGTIKNRVFQAKEKIRRIVGKQP
ncbi:MAG: sigma-70 family RNA polymerase sigma factor [Candidatus Aminicenantes bacterium]|nr:sigma-70 family RNA polymerase sigma factor [Candidatus Aminicenantes bacterium]